MPQYRSILEAAQRLPGRPHYNSVRRWMYVGCSGVKLRSVRFGGKRLTTDEWIEEFTQAVTAATTPASEHFKAEAQLDKMGV